jgi:hypothetical protein
LDDPGVAFVNQDIGRFDVTVDHTFLVGIVDSKANGRKEMNNVGGGEKFYLIRGVGNVVGEGRPFYVIHH